MCEWEDCGVAGWPVKGIASLALTANKWSLLWSNELTCSSNLKFSARNWCRHESRDATEILALILPECLKNWITHYRNVELVPSKTATLVPTASPITDREFGVCCHRHLPTSTTNRYQKLYSNRPCCWLLPKDEIQLGIRCWRSLKITEAMTLWCSWGPIMFELSFGLKILCASNSEFRWSDIFCAMLELGFSWLPSMCGAVTPFWNLKKQNL